MTNNAARTTKQPKQTPAQRAPPKTKTQHSTHLLERPGGMRGAIRRPIVVDKVAGVLNHTSAPQRHNSNVDLKPTL